MRAGPGDLAPRPTGMPPLTPGSLSAEVAVHGEHLDAEVSDYVTELPEAREFLDRMAGMVDFVSDGYLREGKRYVTVAIGCTGGKHRSVAMAEALAALLANNEQLSVRVLHRDLGRE